MEKNGKNKIKLTDKVTKENLNSPQFHKWVARILAVCFILMLAVQFIGCMSFSTYASETETITLKAGTYMFNDYISTYSGDIPINATCTAYNDVRDTYDTWNINNLKFGVVGIETLQELVDAEGIEFTVTKPVFTLIYDYIGTDGYSYDDLVYGDADVELIPIIGLPHGWATTVFHVGIKSLTLPTDQEVDYAFGSWFIANTNYNEVNAPSTLSMDIYGSIDKTQLLYTLNYNEGMTWREWCASEYNTINAYITDVSALDDNNNTTIMYGDIVCLALPNYDETNGFYNQTAMASYFIKDTQFIGADTVISTGGGNYYYVDTIYHVVSNEYANAYDKGYLDGKTDGEQIGYNEGYENGYWEGYQEGEYTGESNANGQNFGQNLIGNTFNGILGALNSITIYQTPNGTPVTIMGIVWGVIGIAVFIWILKLFVGG